MSQQINLFNPIFLKTKKYFSAVTMAQAIGLLLLGSAMMIAYTNYQLSELSREANATSTQLAAVKVQAAKVDVQYGPKQKDQVLEETVQAAESELKALQHIIAILQKSDFGNTRGYAEYMRAFSRQIVSGVWLSGFSIEGSGSHLSIEGHALKPDLVPAFINRLKREPVLQGTSFAALEIHSPAGVDSAQANSVTGQHRSAVTYVNFSLRSSDVGKAQSEPIGAKAK